MLTYFNEFKVMSHSRDSKKIKLNHEVTAIAAPVVATGVMTLQEQLHEQSIKNAQLIVRNQRQEIMLRQASSDQSELLNTTASLSVQLAAAEQAILNLKIKSELDNQKIALLLENKQLNEQLKQQNEMSHAAYNALNAQFLELSAKYRDLNNNYLLLGQSYTQLTKPDNVNPATTPIIYQPNPYSSSAIFKPAAARPALPLNVNIQPLGPSSATSTIQASNSAFTRVKQ